MRSVGYARTGEIETLELFSAVEPQEPGEGEVRIRIHRSGVNPTDWKSRRGALHIPIPQGGYQVPHHDGAGVVDKLGKGVKSLVKGQRVWVWQAAYRRLGGTSQDYVVISASRVEPLPDGVSFDTGACLGIPFMTAHRALTVSEGGPAQLSRGALVGYKVLVAGGAGAVGNAAIQLARWAGATVVATVSGPEKEKLARAAGADHVINYKTQDVAAEVRTIASDGVDIIVEVSAVVNAGLDAKVIKPNGVIAIYANDGGNDLHIPVRETMTSNARYQFILIYTVTEAAKVQAAKAIGHALQDGAVAVGDERGVPVHHYRLNQTRQAHAALEKGGIVGRVVIDLTQD
ncbi:NADPH:quinone reductase [Bradyrhizobium commune]|uniref:NADPH:quinone reductase n=1 Tax=Bradyrhizobium commune TaxID=83627 RepID=A0A7S9D5C9_9BRAD|nr:NADPH:quinone reductase [Bradyrhizobium commune]QPF90694.1 NADPH:quinone reductase [Bradyrhizobium commune]